MNIKSNHSTILFTIAFMIIAMISAKPISAETCVTQYGGSQYGTSCAPKDLTINKEVQKIGVQGSDGGAVYVENLSISEASASAGMYMTFRLTVKNSSNKEFKTVEVKDIFPPYMTYPTSGGSITGGDVKSAVYDPSNRTLTMKLENMKPGESRQIIVTAKVEESEKFPAGKSTFCVSNLAQVKAEDRFDEDTAQVCVNNNVKGVSTLPKAGSHNMLIMAVSAMFGFAGYAVMKKRS